MSQQLTAAERGTYIDQYLAGVEELERAYNEAPEESRHFRPAPGEWSIHEIICHCADMEPLGGIRVRMLAAEPEPVLQAVDQDLWAEVFRYENLPVESALALIRATRIHTAAILRSLPEQAWSKVGMHSETGPYSIITWLTYWADHLHIHAEQIRANLQAYQERQN